MKLNELIANREEMAKILLNRSKTLALIKDFTRNEKSETNALMNAYDAGVILKIEAAYPLDPLAKSRLVNNLKLDYSMREDRAKWAVDTWVAAITPDIIKKLPEECSDINFFSEQITSVDTPTTESLPNDTFISVSREYDKYYVNVSLTKKTGCIYIPCGMGETDCGFYICGLNETKRCAHRHANIYALVYNYIIRNSRIIDADKPIYLKNIQTAFQIDYLKVFRIETIILQLIKNNHITGTSLHIKYDGEPDELKYAIEIINNYAALFCRLIGITDYQPLKQNKNITAIAITLSGGNGVYVENNRKPCNAREIWYGQKINYRLTEKNLSDLEYLLNEISPFGSFKDGQFDALKDMLSTNGHSICIMPTGCGKSLVFYMASLLQPMSVFVVAPTEILIRDQIRNLQKFHHFDNVAHLRLLADNDFSNFKIQNNLIYLTPSTFQSVYLFKKFRHINENMEVSYVVLDEIHCLSNWGHDFRPEYLMLSKELNKYLGRTTFLGFTATANYTVIEDVSKQLSISKNNILSPISYEKYNYSYDFREVETTENMYNEVCTIVAEHLKNNERTIIFTKNDNISDLLSNKIGYEADVLKNNRTEAYQLFADEKSKILIATDELGIGVNLPNVKNIIHFGLPISKSEYVQEIGRAGRADEKVTSYIVYLKNAPNNVPANFFQRDIPRTISIDRQFFSFKNTNSDYYHSFNKLSNNMVSKEVLNSNLLKLYNNFSSWAVHVNKYSDDQVDNIKKYLFMLYAIGYVDDWYAWSRDDINATTKIIISVPYETRHIQCVQKRSLEYFDFLGNCREQISKIQHASQIEDIITIYVDWYYAGFLYHNKEMFLDFFEFIKNNADCNSEKITTEIKEYFHLKFIKIKSTEEKYSTLTLKKVADMIFRGIGRSEIANIERLNSNQYSYSLDFLLLLAKLRMDNYFDGSRFDRVLIQTDKKEYVELFDAISKVYMLCNIETKFEILKNLEQRLPKDGMVFYEFLDSAYVSGAKDPLFYGILAQKINTKHQTLLRKG